MREYRPCKVIIREDDGAYREKEARFHEWGVNYEEFDGGPGNFSCAIVELEDGQVATVPADYVRFIDTEWSV